MKGFKIIEVSVNDQDLIEQSAEIIVETFRDTTPAWPDMESAQEEVDELLGEGRIFLAAVDEAGKVLGIIGGESQYDGHVWELHPLAVRINQQRRGIGRRLVEAFEDRVRALGGITITLGTDDEVGHTSLFGIDLYPDVWQHLKRIRNLGRHPYDFYLKMGYVITGVVPDANGPGKPDILMSKRVSELD
jgi:aminoglycoside 6'-N-acetyltransferase I